MDRPWTLVTGASGFIGGRLVHALVERGEPVKAFVRPGANLSQLRGLPEQLLQLAYGDITVEHTVYRALAGCRRMYHVAANYKMWDARPERILTPAIEGTRSVLEAARKRELERIVLTSTVGTLGVCENRDEPMDEEHQFNLADPDTYIRAKLESERLALALSLQHALPLVLVLPSSVYGPGDWKPTPTGASVVQYLKLPANVRPPVTDGGINIVDVDDVAQGHILAMQQGQIGEKYILGGEDVTFAELIEFLSDITGLAPPGRHVGPGLVGLVGWALELRARFGGPEPLVTHRLARDYASDVIWVTSEKAETELGYTHRPARDALARSVRFYLERGYVPDKAARRVRLELRPT